LEKLDTELRTNLSEGDYNKLVERIENSGAVEETERMTRSLYRVILRKGKALERCLKTVVDQSLPDQADFFEAYAQALKNPPLDQTGALVMEKSTGVSNIYLLMVLNWKFVRKFTSAAKCYLWLSKILGSQVVGNEERIQKMCARFGVKFSRHKRNKRKKKRKYRTR
jgi:vacuolar-type H+-ATPase catalytic subunit A/Vma1